MSEFISLDSIIDELLSFEKKEQSKPLPFLQRIYNFAKRQEIEREILKQSEGDNERTLKLGRDTESFLSSSWYRDLVEPRLRQTIKSGMQTLIRDGETLSECQLKAKIAVIKETLGFVASLRLKIIRAEQIKENVK